MSDREALAAALTATWSERVLDYEQVILTAARERLAQLPRECETCIATPGTVDVIDGFADCPTCHGSGKVYPAELVERLRAKPIIRTGFLKNDEFGEPTSEPRCRVLSDEETVAVLDALNETP